MAASMIAHRRRMAVALVATLVCAGAAALFIVRGPAASASVSTTPGAEQATGASVLVARSAGGHDALWLVSPADGTATAAGSLPGIAAEVAASPDGLNVAYLPASGSPYLWIGYGPLAPRNINLSAAGLKRVDSMTWISNGRVVVAGPTAGKYASERQDRLFVVTVSTGKVSSFRHLRGVEPNAASGIGKLTYVHFTTLVPATPQNQHRPLIRESLKLLRLSGNGAGTTVTSEQYRLFADQRAFSEPLLAPTGTWLFTGVTGSDVSVTYALRDAGMGLPLFTVMSASLQAGAWGPDGHRVAFGGEPPLIASSPDACVWVYDTSTGALTRTPKGVLSGQMIRGIAWSGDGRLVASAFTPTTSGAVHHNEVMAADDLSMVKDLGPGHAVVWVQ